MEQYQVHTQTSPPNLNIISKCESIHQQHLSSPNPFSSYLNIIRRPHLLLQTHSLVHPLPHRSPAPLINLWSFGDGVLFNDLSQQKPPDLFRYTRRNDCNGTVSCCSIREGVSGKLEVHIVNHLAKAFTYQIKLVCFLLFILTALLYPSNTSPDQIILTPFYYICACSFLHLVYILFVLWQKAVRFIITSLPQFPGHHHQRQTFSIPLI